MVALLLATQFSSPSHAALADAPVIQKQTSSAIVSTFTNRTFKNFDVFLQSVRIEKRFDDLSTAIEAYRHGSPLPETQQNQIYRLLGIYTQLKYGKEAIETLRHLVSFPTFEVENIPSHENPHIIDIGKAIEQIAVDFNLDFQNIDNRVFAISLNGNGGENIGLHAHADVVPANKNLWVLKDGTQLDPFVLTTIDNRMYGRGSEDDKNGIVVALYAMKVIKEEGLPLFNSFKLLVDTTEETGSDAIPYYMERHPVPGYNLALDGSYPVITAEKGFGVVLTTFPVRNDNGASGHNSAEFTTLTGELAFNQIPSKSTTKILTSSPKHLKSQLDNIAQEFIAEHGNNFTIDTRVEGHDLLLSVNGVSAHSSDPGSGVNPISRMLKFINLAKQKLDIKSNHITDAAQYASENWGLGYHGKVLGIDYQDDFMGPLTAALTLVKLNDSQLQLAVNLRAPIGKTPDQLKSEVKEKLDDWQKNNVISLSIEHTQQAPMYRNPEGGWTQTLLDITSENLNIERKFGSMSGGTSIHDLPNGVSFGLAMPNLKYTGHNANEFKTVDQFLLDLQIVTEMMVRLGNLKQMQ